MDTPSNTTIPDDPNAITVSSEELIWIMDENKLILDITNQSRRKNILDGHEMIPNKILIHSENTDRTVEYRYKKSFLSDDRNGYVVLSYIFKADDESLPELDVET